jgi:hypothetical protein
MSWSTRAGAAAVVALALGGAGCLPATESGDGDGDCTLLRQVFNGNGCEGGFDSGDSGDFFFDTGPFGGDTGGRRRVARPAGIATCDLRDDLCLEGPVEAVRALCAESAYPTSFSLRASAGGCDGVPAGALDIFSEVTVWTR